jgi:hypothetical protein
MVWDLLISGMILSGIIGLFLSLVILVLGYTPFMAWLQPAEIQSVSEENATSA